MLVSRSIVESTSGSSLSDELSVSTRTGKFIDHAADPPNGSDDVFVGEVNSVLPKDEPLTPGILYVGVAGLAGSVLARNSKFVVRYMSQDPF
jgi:hypothetical protein